MSDSFWRDGLFESFSELVEIKICDNNALVPNKNKLLRCFQYIKTDTVSVGPIAGTGTVSTARSGIRATTARSKARSPVECMSGKGWL